MKKYSLKLLQLNYLAADLSKKQSNDSVCMYCWNPVKQNCGCNVNTNAIKNDTFLNLTEPMEVR